MAKRKNIRKVTPAGIASFPHVIKPDTKFKEEGEYKVNLIVDPTDDGVQEWLDEIEEYSEKAHAEKGKESAKVKKYSVHLPFEPDLDKDGEETGKVVIKAKQSAQIKVDGEMVDIDLPLFDSKNNRISPDSVWGGSEMKLAVTLIPFANPSSKSAGVSLRLSAVQILKLVEGSQDGSAFGFDEGSGFEADDDGMSDSPSASNENDDDGGEEEDF